MGDGFGLYLRPNRLISRARFKKRNLGSIVACSTHGWWGFYTGKLTHI